MFQYLTIQCLLKSCLNSSNPSSGTLQMKEKDRTLDQNKSISFGVLYGNDFQRCCAVLDEGMKSRDPRHGAGRAGTRCHRAARLQPHRCEPSPSQLRLPASTPISTVRQRLAELASQPLKTRKITLLFPPGIVAHSQWEETDGQAIGGQKSSNECH